MSGTLLRLVLAALCVALGNCRDSGDGGGTGAGPESSGTGATEAPLPVHELSVSVADGGTFDLGPTATWATVRGIVHLTNDTARPVELLDCRSNCGCLAADCPRGQSLAPGETYQVEIRMRSGEETGQLLKRMDFVFRDHPPLSVVFRLDAVAHVQASPAGLRPATQPTEVTFSSIDGQPFRVISCDPPVTRGLPTESGTSCTVLVDWDAWMRAERPRHITFAVDHPLCPKVTVSVWMPPPE